MNTFDFTRSIPGFADLSHPEKIQRFAWYLHVHGGKQRFAAADVAHCYDDAHLDRPANLHLTLKELTDRKPAVLLRDTQGYRLEARVRQALDAQYGQRRDQIAVSNLVADLTAKVPNVAEKAFLQETIKCYSCSAFRAAIVMAWALAMDHVLEWILADAARLGTFNARIGVCFPSKKSLVIRTRMDFQDLKESQIIDILTSADLVSKDIGKVLDEKLDRRNTAAHPSLIIMTQAQAEDVITDLINNVVLMLA